MGDAFGCFAAFAGHCPGDDCGWYFLGNSYWKEFRELMLEPLRFIYHKERPHSRVRYSGFAILECAFRNFNDLITSRIQKKASPAVWTYLFFSYK